MDECTVFLLGDDRVGKTAFYRRFILNRFAEESFVDNVDPTIEEPYRKEIVVDDRACTVEVVDPPSHSLDQKPLNVENYTRGGRRPYGFILLYSVASRAGFDQIPAFRQLLKSDDPIFVLVGTKSDLAREVSAEEGAALARALGCEFIEASAKTSQNVDRAFANLVRAVRRAANPDPAGTATEGKSKERKQRRCAII
ncbi:P-loop containing nucleoside triphosphate hydrolase protein [Mycena filopes]|nr:P-loop containing nucleoside triphosphate hydrolase protein [Mycena filopes]